MEKPDKCKNKKCSWCKTIKNCTYHKIYENKLDETLARHDIQKARKIVEEWEGIK